MAQQTINNGESGLIVRGKINSNFTDLYAGSLTSLSVSTASGTVTLNFDTNVVRFFVGSASFATAKTIAFSNDSVALYFSFMFQITDVAAVLTLPSEVIMSDARWNTSSQEWTSFDTGKFRAKGDFDGTNWHVTITGPYS